MGSPDGPSSELFSSCVRTEQERLATLIPSDWRLPLLGEEKEAAWSEETLRSVSRQNDSALLPAMLRSWTGDTVYLVSGDFIPRAAVAVRFPVPGIVVEWTPWPPHRTSTVVYLYVQTRPEAAAELQRTLEGLRQIPPFHFDRQSRLVPFAITRAGKQIILHCISPRSFAFRIGDFELSQELSDSGTPRTKNARKPNAAERASQPNPTRKAVRPGT
jgi:hypothetical protein